MAEEHQHQDDRADGRAEVPHGLRPAAGGEDEVRALVEAIADTVSDALLVLTPDLRVEAANAAFYDAFRTTPEAVEGRSVLALGDGRWDVEALRSLLERAPLRSGSGSGSVGVELDGRTVLPRVRRLEPLRRVLLVLEDVTERRRTEEALYEMRESLEVALEAARMGSWDVDLGTGAAHTSLRHSQIFGYARPVRPWGPDIFREHIVPEDRGRYDEGFARALEMGELDLEVRVRRADGVVRWVHVQGRVHYDEDGTPLRVAGVTVDVTQRKRVEEAARQVAERDAFRVALNEALRPLTDPTAIQAEAARVLGERLRAHRVFYGEVAADGEHLVVRADYRSGVSGMVGRYRLDDYGPPVVDELRAGQTLIVSDVAGDERLASAEKVATIGLTVGAYVIVPLIKEGRLVAVLAVHQDRPRDWAVHEIALVEKTAEHTWATVERERAEAEVRQLNSRLEALVAQRTRQLVQVNRELEAFNYSVSHDLRAPLRGVDGFSQAVLEDYGDRLDETGRRYLERVRAGAQRMGRLIDDLLRLSRVSRSELRVREVDLGAIAREIARDLQERDPERRAEIRVAPDMVVRGDEGLLRIALENLMENAWKYSCDEDPARIEVGVEERAGERTFFVCDNGAGFDPRYADKLFVPFQRLHSSERFPGSGIGLPMVQRIVSLHGGTVRGEGEVDAGATFSFTLPEPHAPRKREGG